MITRNPAAVLQPPFPGRWESQEQHKANASGEHQATQADQQSPKHQPLPVIQLNDAPNEHRVGTDSEHEGRWYTNPDWWVAGFTAALVVVTAGLWIFTALLWRTTRRAVIDGEKAIVAAIRHADTADITASVMKETAERQLRAYVFVDTAQFSNANLGEIPIGHLDIKNFGRTPAFRMTSWAKIGLATYPLVGGLPPRENSPITKDSPLAPSGSYVKQVPFFIPLQQAHLSQLQNRTHAMYLLGEILYWDAFNVQRMTRFCFYSGGNFEFGPARATYHEGNDAT